MEPPAAPPAESPPPAAPAAAAPPGSAAAVVAGPGRTQVPIALVAALAFYFVTNVVVGVGYATVRDGGDFDRDAFARWSLLATGFDFAFLALALAGTFDLVRRTSGTARAGARIVLGAVIAMFALALFGEYANRIYARTNPADMEAVWTWTNRIRSTTWLAFGAGLVLSGWHVPVVRRLAGPLIVAILVAVPYDFYAAEIYELFGSGPYKWVIRNGVTDLVATGLAIAVIWSSRPALDAGSGWGRAATALDRTAAALYARLWIAVSGALLVVMMFGSRGESGEGVAHLWAVGIPLANAIAGVVLVSGILGAAGLTAPRAPRARLYTAGAAMMVTVAISSVQILYLVQIIFGDNDSFDRSEGGATIQALPIVLPAIGLAAMVALAAGLHGIAAALDSDQLKQRAASALGIVITCQMLAVAIPYGLANSREITPGTALAALLAAAAAAVVALVTLARLCRSLATGLRARNDLPTATVISW